MKCAKLSLQERTKIGPKVLRPVTSDKPRRYCQKRLVNPQHEEDPRWIDVLERFHCNDLLETEEKYYSEDNHTKEDDLYLSVQTLQFKCAEKHTKRPRTSFKYKTVTDGNTHRMFVKQTVTNEELSDEDRSSQLTCYYYDDYAKYLSNTDRSRPSSGKSSIFLQGMATRFKANKAVQVDLTKANDTKKTRKTESKNIKTDLKNDVNTEELDASADDAIKDTKISYHKSGKRKSLTISRTQSPETVQIIRVDVVCNRSSSIHSDYDDVKVKENIETVDKKTETLNIKNSHFANKYLLTNTIKSLDENVSGGAKVTLLCKTFRLTDRSKMLFSRKPLDIAKVTSHTSKAKVKE